MLKNTSAELSSSSSSTTSTNSIVNTTSIQKYLGDIRSSISKLATYICKLPSGQNQMTVKGTRKDFLDSLNSAVLMEPKVAMDVFKVQIMFMMNTANEAHLIPWRSLIEERKWIDALECSKTFAQIVFYAARLRFYQTRPPLVVDEEL